MTTNAIEVDFLRDIRHGGKASQPDRVATALVDFMRPAQHSLQIAIYDFRLSPQMTARIVPELIQIAARGVKVQIAYDHQKPFNQPVNFGHDDPKPRGTHAYLQQEFKNTPVELRPIESWKLMHNKYVVRDGETPAAAV